jgi:hypothetical protein
MAIQILGTLADLVKIQQCAAKHGWLMTLEEANKIWSNYSSSRDARWLIVDETSTDKNLWDIISDEMSCEK